MIDKELIVNNLNKKYEEGLNIESFTIILLDIIKVIKKSNTVKDSQNIKRVVMDILYDMLEEKEISKDDDILDILIKNVVPVLIDEFLIKNTSLIKKIQKKISSFFSSHCIKLK